MTAFRIAALAASLAAASPALATVTSLSILDGGASSRATAWDQDGSSRYFAMGGIYGKSGDYQADVFSDFGLGAHVTNWPSSYAVTIASLPALAAGTNAIGSVNPLPVSGTGLTGVVKTGLTNSAVSVKASAGTFQVAHCDNNNSATVYVELFNTSSVTLGTTAPAWVIPVPPLGGGEPLAVGVALGGSAIYAAAVTTYNGSTAPATTLTCSFGVM